MAAEEPVVHLVFALLIELVGPPQDGVRRRDVEEQEVEARCTPGLAPVFEQADDVEQREPAEQCQPRPVASHMCPPAFSSDC